MTTFAASSGAAENMRLTLKLLPRDQFEVFLATRSGQSMEQHLPQDVTLLPLRHLDRAIRPLPDLWALLELYRLCKRWRFDIVHTHNSKDGILGRWAAHLAGVPVIIHTIHTLSFKASELRLANALYAYLERLTAPLTAALLAVSRENIQEQLKRRIGSDRQYKVVYSGLELERYSLPQVTKAKARETLGLPRASAWIGWFGRFNQQKDPLTFVHAASQVAQGFADVRFIVCGDDPLGHDLWPAVESLARELGVRDRLHVLGFRPDLPIVLKAVDIVMHSSRYEGMGRVVCEALASERAVAGTAVDGVQEAIISGQRGGILVPSGDPAALAVAALTLLRKPEYACALASAGRKWVEANLSAHRMVRDIAAVYDEALAAVSSESGRRQRPVADG